MSEIIEYDFPNFSKFISDFGHILFPHSGVFVRDKYIFRGHGSAGYKLRSSFDRRFSHLSLLDRVKRYGMLISYLTDELQNLGVIHAREIDLLGVAQHQGMPTRLLDWTSSPLIAAYFAFHERVVRLSTDKYVSIWCLDQTDKYVWNPKHGVEIAKLKARTNERATRQLGYVTNLSTPDDTIEQFVSRLNPGRTVLWKFNILANDARSAFAFLDSCNVRAAELFGELEGAVRTAVEQLYLVEGP